MDQDNGIELPISTCVIPHNSVHQTGWKLIHQSGSVDDRQLKEQAVLVLSTPVGLFNTVGCVEELLGTKMEAQTFALREIRNIPESIDNPYVDGVSVTHGMPRAHIWTFSAGGSDATVLDYVSNCPCANPAATVIATPAPSFVGDNYFCESGNSGGSSAGGSGFHW